MGEYATRISDGEQVKIGTCELMYYTTLRDILGFSCKWNPLTNSVGIRYRLPFADEFDVLVGDYEPYERSVALPGFEGDDDMQPGLIQFSKDGLLVNVPCHHGRKLPDIGEGNAHWNGKPLSHLTLNGIHVAEDGIKPSIGCVSCRKSWWCDDWDGVLPAMADEVMRAEIERYLDIEANTPDFERFIRCMFE
jgi:hypothetical protein